MKNKALALEYPLCLRQNSLEMIDQIGRLANLLD